MADQGGSRFALRQVGTAVAPLASGRHRVAALSSASRALAAVGGIGRRFGTFESTLPEVIALVRFFSAFRLPNEFRFLRSKRPLECTPPEMSPWGDYRSTNRPPPVSQHACTPPQTKTIGESLFASPPGAPATPAEALATLKAIEAAAGAFGPGVPQDFARPAAAALDRASRELPLTPSYGEVRWAGWFSSHRVIARLLARSLL